MEILLNNFKNEVTSYQSFIHKFKKRAMEDLLAALSQAKTDDNLLLADTIEQNLSRLNEQLIRDRLENSNLFEVLNNEKMTPMFLKLAKIKSNTGSLADICDDNGIPFPTPALRQKHILDTYSKMYGEVNAPVSVGDIVNFLGPDIINHNITNSKKVPIELKNQFETELTLEELDCAIKSAKISSAGGADGINNRVLKKFWHLFRIPLYNYAKYLFEGGNLTQSFNSASIKLIPKKGDLTRIGNWRPISLLNCIYKVVSRAVNNRLQKVAPFILSRAQKGFVKNRYIQECLINVIEKIAHCNKQHIPALVVTIDQAKAFDTVSHSFMTAAYRFFNFGENFIRLMNTIGTGRTAAIMWENGSLSARFDLKSGRAQGDGPSPLQYNIAEQILLLKIELDPVIQPAFVHAVEASRIPAPLDWFTFESNKSTGKTEALADDTTVIIKHCRTSLLSLKNTLFEFGELSGLKCNEEKTCILPVGGINALQFQLDDIPFQTVNSVKLLGLDIDSNLDCLANAHEKTCEKIAAILRFWSRFWLSLPGRINIVKTLCLSQINYLGCFITPDERSLKTMDDLIVKFVKGNMNISKNRLYSKPCNGGLGLIDINSFLCSQQVLWIKRILHAGCDNWREDVYNLSFGNPLILHPKLIDKVTHPIIYNIAVSYVKFKQKFYAQNDNFKKSYLLCNPVIDWARGDKRPLDLNFFRQNPTINPERLAKTRFKDVYSNGPMQLDVINANNDLNLGLNLNTYLRLMGACTNFRNSLKANRVNDSTSIDLKDFFNSFKKGSKSVRRIFSNVPDSDICNLKQVQSFLRITNITLNEINVSEIKIQFSLWANPAFKMDFREFVFKFYNNNLGINTRVSHFAAEVNRNCTFCTLGNEINDESFEHLFLQCNKIINIRERLFQEFFSDIGADPAIIRKIWFGFPPTQLRDRKLVAIAALLIQFHIWNFKKKKKIPHLNIIRNETLLDLKVLYKVNKSYFTNDESFALSRNWTNLLSAGVH
jgi:hypothetical protein